MPRGNVFIVDELRGWERPAPPPPHPALSKREPELERALPGEQGEAGGPALRARNLLFESFAHAGVEDGALQILDRAAARCGPPFAFRIIKTDEGLTWEVGFRGDPARGAPGPALGAEFGLAPPPSTANAAVLALTAGSVGEGRPSAIFGQRMGTDRVELLDATGQPTMTFRFFEHRRDPKALLAHLAEQGLWNLPGVHGGQVLWPELMRASRVGVGSGRSHALLHVAVPLANVIFFLGAVGWPEHFAKYLSSREAAFEHVPWDVSFDVRLRPGGVSFHDCGIHGPY
jgi:hypothetical protein